jgi:hypothetical protein
VLRKVPGIDIPAATEAIILHAAAFLEFKGHVERLAREGHDFVAYTCWMHAVEIRHPLSSLQPVNLNCSLLWSRCLGCTSECQRCAEFLEGSSSPVEQPGTLGPTTMSIRRRWTSFFWRSGSTTVAKDLKYGLQLRCTAGDAGQLGMGSCSKPGALGARLSTIVYETSLLGMGSAAPAFQGGTAVCNVGSVGRCWWTHEGVRVAACHYTAAFFCSPHLNDFVRMRYHGIRWHRLLCGASSFFLLKIGTLLTPFARSQ